MFYKKTISSSYNNKLIYFYLIFLSAKTIKSWEISLNKRRNIPYLNKPTWLSSDQIFPTLNADQSSKHLLTRKKRVSRCFSISRNNSKNNFLAFDLLKQTNSLKDSSTIMSSYWLIMTQSFFSKISKNYLEVHIKILF